MKKTIFFVLAFVLIALPALATEQVGLDDSNAGIQNLETVEIQQDTVEAEQNSVQVQRGRDDGTDDIDDDITDQGVEEVINEDEDGDKSLQVSNQQQIQVKNQEQQSINIQAQNQGEDFHVQTQAKVKAKNANELKVMIKEKEQEMAQELSLMNNKDKQKVWQNQNQVREAVHALLVSEDLVGGIGKQISEIAREFNNSVEKTIQSEEKIQARSKIKTFFFGGDEDSAEELEEEVNQNQNRIQELKQLKENSSCQQEVKEVIQEQIQNIEQEQTRLGELAQEQKQKKGIFGWLFGWLK